MWEGEIKTNNKNFSSALRAELKFLLFVLLEVDQILQIQGV
jgi:hypothetical protein